MNKRTSFAGLGLALALGLSTAACAQESSSEKEEREPASFPETEIFLFDINLAAEGDVLSKGKNVTSRPGYDNQPFFTKDSESFLYSRDDGYQTDVYEYIIASDKTVQITESDNTEFSPTPFPDNKSLAFVTDRSNSIYFAGRDNANAPEWALKASGITEPVGYFAWNHNTGDILYWSQYGANVTLTHAERPEYHYVSGDAVPSTPHIIPGTDEFSFVHRQGNSQVWIKALNPDTKAVRPLTPIVGHNANYSWTPDGAILMIEGTVLHRWTEDSETGWEEVSDLSAHGLKSANRVAISPDASRLAIVGLPQD